MVQLVMEDDRKCYRASVVSEDNLSKGFSAHVYNSKTATWNIMCSGYVNGVNSELLWSHMFLTMLQKCCLILDIALQLEVFMQSQPTQWRRTVCLCSMNLPCFGQHNCSMYLVSEFTWDSSISDLRD